MAWFSAEIKNAFIKISPSNVNLQTNNQLHLMSAKSGHANGRAG
jgi:hypothetical protein